MNASAADLAIKDVSVAHPIATEWRPVFCEIVSSFVRGDYELAKHTHVSPLSPKVASFIKTSISDFGEQLAELPEQTWKTSIAQWMGTHWDVLVDLWTVESGESDLVLSALVHETADGFLVDVGSVHVP